MSSSFTSSNSLPPTTFSTLVELIQYFSSSNKKSFKVYDMGRRISEISLSGFIDFEQANIPWPTPLLQSAWFAICFNSSSTDTNFWFLKFPLDEQGKLIQASRDDYIAQFIAQIDGKVRADNQLTNKNVESIYGFKPSEEKLANINAIYKAQLGLEASKYFHEVVDYLNEKNNKKLSNWQHLGYQGIADFCSRLTTQPKLVKLLSDHLTSVNYSIPQTVLNSFASCLEHLCLPKSLEKKWLNNIDFTQLEQVITGLRVVSLSQTPKIQTEFIKSCLNSKFKTYIELLALISGRNWECLHNPELMLLYLEALAVNSEGEQSFTILCHDLMFIPGMREYVLEQFRNPKRSEQLTTAIGLLYARL